MPITPWAACLLTALPGDPGDLVGPPEPPAVVREVMACARRFVPPPARIERLLNGIPDRVVREALGPPTRVEPRGPDRVVWLYRVGEGPGYQQWLGLVVVNGRVESAVASRVPGLPSVGFHF